MAAVLRELGVRAGDRVLLYMPMIPEATFAMLACARLGAIHSVVFAGFLGVVAAVILICWMLMLAAPRLMRVLGVTGASVMSRLSGVVLAALAVQFMIDGLRGSFPRLLSP